MKLVQAMKNLQHSIFAIGISMAYNAANDFLKVLLVDTFKNVNINDIICLSETFLDRTISLGDKNLYNT